MNYQLDALILEDTCVKSFSQLVMNSAISWILTNYIFMML